MPSEKKPSAKPVPKPASAKAPGSKPAPSGNSVPKSPGISSGPGPSARPGAKVDGGSGAKPPRNGSPGTASKPDGNAKAKQTGAKAQAQPGQPQKQGQSQHPDQPLQPGQPMPAKQVEPDSRLTPKDIDFQPPLVICLSIISRLLGKPVSSATLKSGIPQTEGVITAASIVRSAERIGITAKTVYREKLRTITKLVLPCILLLRGGNACVLMDTTKTTARVMIPGHGMDETEIPMAKLDDLEEALARARELANLDG